MRSDRDDLERTIEALCELYPKTFFVEGRKRRPLKHGIAADIAAEIQKDPNHELRFDDIDDAIDWYTSHEGYQIHLSTAGAGRVDLKGSVTAKVTVAEANVAKTELQRIHDRKNARRALQVPPPPPAPASVARPLVADSSLAKADLVAAIEKHVRRLAAMIAGGDIADELDRHLARSVVQLLADEIRTLDARLG